MFFLISFLFSWNLMKGLFYIDNIPSLIKSSTLYLALELPAHQILVLERLLWYCCSPIFKVSVLKKNSLNFSLWPGTVCLLTPALDAKNSTHFHLGTNISSQEKHQIFFFPFPFLPSYKRHKELQWKIKAWINKHSEDPATNHPEAKQYREGSWKEPSCLSAGTDQGKKITCLR